jgi:hypothetical protein
MARRCAGTRAALAVVIFSAPCKFAPREWPTPATRLASLTGRKDIVMALECEAGVFRVSNQQEAVDLNECVILNKTLVGNVTLTPVASGDLNFTNFGMIEGSVIGRNIPSLKSLYFESGYLWDLLDGSIDNIYLQNLTAFQKITAPNMTSIFGALSLEDLPSLETVDMQNLDMVFSLTLSELPKLKNFLVAEENFGSGGDVTIKNVALDSLDRIFNIGFRQRRVSVDGIPNVNTLAYSLYDSETVTINGNGKLAMQFNCTNCDRQRNALRRLRVGSLTVSGLASLSRNHTEVGSTQNLAIGNLTATRNFFTTLPIDFDSLNGLYIQDNENLTSLMYHPNFSSYNWTDIVISGNPKLRLTAAAKPKSLPGADGLGTSWVWPTKNVSRMVFDGSFDNAFL